MAANGYDVGAEVKISGAFSVAGVLTDPTTVVATVVDPAGNRSTYTYGNGIQVVRDGAGLYHALVDLTGAAWGVWAYRWQGTGACQAAEQNTFYVEQPI